jgi:hypothetical protein
VVRGISPSLRVEICHRLAAARAGDRAGRGVVGGERMRDASRGVVAMMGRGVLEREEVRIEVDKIAGGIRGLGRREGLRTEIACLH